MILKMFAVYDMKVGAYMPPFTMRSRGEAVRSFMDAVADKSGQFIKHPEDYALWSIGDFNDQSGEVTGACEVVMRAVEVQPE